MTGKLITLEGGEGVGKSSNLVFIQDYLQKKGIDVTVTREPGGTSIGEKIRELLLDCKNDGQISSDTELLLLFAARAQHMEELILPALRQNRWVLSDRFTDASYAYQGGGRQISVDRIDRLVEWVQGGLVPDFVLLLDTPVEVGLSRAGRRGKKDRFEQETLAFFNRVREVYLQRAYSDPKRYYIIDTEKSFKSVQREIKKALDAFLLSLT